MLNVGCNINQNPTVNDLIDTNKIIKKIKSRDSKLVSPKLGIVNNLKSVIFTDASYVNIPDGASSAGAFVIILCGKD